MTTKRKEEKIGEIIKSFNLEKSEYDDVYTILFGLLENGLDLSSSKIVFRNPEYLQNRFLCDRVIDLSKKNEQVFWEISRITSERDFVTARMALKKQLKGSKRARGANENISFISHRETKNDFSEFHNRIQVIEKELSVLRNELNRTKNENDEFKEIIFDQMLFSNEDKKIQFIPIEIYLDTDNSMEIFNTYEAVLKFLDSIGFKKSFEFKAKLGSWFKRMTAKSKSILSNKEVTDRFKEIEYGVEVNTILKPQSEVDKNHSEALANILKSIENYPNAAIRIGSLIVVKITPPNGEINIQVRTLSIKELHVLNKRPELLSRPSEILIALAKEIEGNDNEELSKN
jgi:hypothetical protein